MDWASAAELDAVAAVAVVSVAEQVGFGVAGDSGQLLQLQPHRLEQGEAVAGCPCGKLGRSADAGTTSAGKRHGICGHREASWLLSTFPPYI